MRAWEPPEVPVSLTDWIDGRGSQTGGAIGNAIARSAMRSTNRNVDPSVEELWLLLPLKMEMIVYLAVIRNASYHAIILLAIS
jgi:hypothetical protein